MEKRPQKTLARTLNCGAAFGTQLVLTIVLFLPIFLLLGKPWDPVEKPSALPSRAAGSSLTTVLRQQLVKAYTIVKSRRPDIADAEAWRISHAVLEESRKRRFDPLLVLAVIQIESDFQHTAVSPVGARGIMQIMPDTGKYLADALRREGGLHSEVFEPESLDDPRINIRLGTYYLHDLRERFQNLALALIAYNLGPGEVQSRIENKIEFSEEFAAAVMDVYHGFKRIRTPRS